jgi:hypothetical protein
MSRQQIYAIPRGELYWATIPIKDEIYALSHKLNSAKTSKNKIAMMNAIQKQCGVLSIFEHRMREEFGE